MTATNIAIDQLPIIDMSRLDDGEAGEIAIASDLDAIFSSIGFCYFRNIGVPQSLTDGLFAASRAFHAQPEAAKRALAMNSTHPVTRATAIAPSGGLRLR